MGKDWKQDEFNTREVDDVDLMDKLDAQIGVLLALERQRAEETDEGNDGNDGQAPNETLVSESGEEDEFQSSGDITRQLDPILLRTACSNLKRVLVGAAVTDGAVLLADSVTDPVDIERRQEKWAKWLLDARCWPPLVKQHWQSIRYHGAALVSERLKAEFGSEPDTPVGYDILAAVRQLELADLVTEETMQKAFPGEGEQMTKLRADDDNQ